MKNYSDLQATNLKLDIELELVGSPMFTVAVNNNVSTQLSQSYELDLLKPFSVVIELRDKVYTTEYETAVVIRRLAVDNIELIPQYDCLAEYTNDHNHTGPTSYLGFNGCWVFVIDRPFYQWLHQAQAQGWLLT
jgi:hypothetical protein